jgi:TM2 domain-containing membrane protein YozV
MFQLLEILALNELHRWKDAQQKFQRYSSNYHLGLDSNTYAEIIRYKPRNPGKARLMSMIIPGSGQMYAGYFLKGLTSTVINTGLVLFTIYSFSNGFYMSGAFTGVALFYLFYNGGATYAYDLAEVKNKDVFDEFNESIKAKLTKEDALKK